MQGIYCIEHIASGKKYIGSSMNIEKRLHGHRRDLVKKTHHNILLQRAVEKHGIDGFLFYTVEETNFTNRIDLLNHEQTFLDQNQGYNIAPANGGDILSSHPDKDEIREKIKQTILEKIKSMSVEERKRKWAKYGDKNPNWRAGGTTLKDCPVCNTSRISRHAASCGNCRIRTGPNNPFYHRHHTTETRERLRQAKSGDNNWIRGIDPSILPYTKQYEIAYPTGETKQVAGMKTIAKEFNVSVECVHATIKRIVAGKIPKRGVFADTIIREVK